MGKIVLPGQLFGHRMGIRTGDVAMSFLCTAQIIVKIY